MLTNGPITTNTIIYCKEWEAVVEFYRDQLKLPVIFSTDWFMEFGLSSVSRLSIANEKRSSIKGCGGKGITIAMEVNDIEAVRTKMEEVGLKPTQLKKHPWDARVFYIFDPEGRRIEIWQFSKSSKTRCRKPNLL